MKNLSKKLSALTVATLFVASNMAMAASRIDTGRIDSTHNYNDSYLLPGANLNNVSG